MRRIVTASVLLFLFVVAPAWAHNHQPTYTYHSTFRHPDPDWDNSDWMADLPDSLLISELTIPGTHESMSRCGGSSIECNKTHLDEQFRGGIRALDIRLYRIWNHFDVRHSHQQHGDDCNSITDHYEFDDALEYAVRFLHDHEDETILMRVQDAGQEFDPQDPFSAIFKKYVESYGIEIDGEAVPFSDYVWRFDSPDNRDGSCEGHPYAACSSDSECDGLCLTNVPTLEQVRGKIVFLKSEGKCQDRNPCFGGLEHYGMRYPSRLFDIQDNFDLYLWELDEKFRHGNPRVGIVGQIENAIMGDPETIYVNFLSGSGGVLPCTVASGHGTCGTGGSRLPTGEVVLDRTCRPNVSDTGCCRRYGAHDEYSPLGICEEAGTTCVINQDCPGEEEDCMVPLGRLHQMESKHACFIGCTCSYDGMNYRTWEVLGKESRYHGKPTRVGMIMMDFPGYALIQEIIDLNFPDNSPPVADAGGPYALECSAAYASGMLNGTGSSDPDPDDMLTYEWSASTCPDASFDDSTSPQPILSLDLTSNPTAACLEECEVSLSVVDQGGLNDSSRAIVQVVDELPPALTCPAEVSVECDESTDPSRTGSPLAVDLCQPSATVAFADASSPGRCPAESELLRTWTTADACGNSQSCDQPIHIVDTTGPSIQCNAPEAIIPPQALTSFTASAVDNCSNLSVAITDYSSVAYTKKGKRVDRMGPRAISSDGATITIHRSGGVGAHIRWTVTATDDCGNVTERECEVEVARPQRHRKATDR